MAIHHRNGCRNLLIQAYNIIGKPLSQLAIAEFGNQRIKTDGSQGMRRMQSSGALHRWFGACFMAFDINGRDEAAPVDLSQPIPDEYREWLGLCDLVTNFGTSEHVRASQREVFRNAHRLCRVGGLMVHAVPKTGTCRRHGCWKYSVEWFAQLAHVQSYIVHLLEDWDKSLAWPGQKNPGEEIYVLAILEKPHSGRFRRIGWRDPPRK